MEMNMSSFMSGKSCRLTLRSTSAGLGLVGAWLRSTLRHIAMMSDAGTPLPDTSAMTMPKCPSSTLM